MRQAEPLRDVMLLLCERLLYAAVADAESSVEALTRLFVALRGSVRASGCECCAGESNRGEMARILDEALGHLQFFDEHAQRVQHVGAILALFEHSGPTGLASGDPSVVFDRIRALLSTQSEWRVLAGVVPGEVGGKHEADRVELF